MQQDWLQQALLHPVFFAQVREDAACDDEVICRFAKQTGSVLLVASGGCTAAVLAENPHITHLHLVDPNPSQIALARLKIEMLALPIEARLELLGHLPLPPEKRKRELLTLFKTLHLPETVLGNLQTVSQKGLDFSGRYEALFEALQMFLTPHRKELEKLCTLSSQEEQSELFYPESSLYKVLKEAFTSIFDLSTLIQLFGKTATQNRNKEFADHFFDQLCLMLREQKAISSPYLSQVILGHYQPNVLPLWLQKNKTKETATSFSCATMQEVLEKAKPCSYDVILLSNILDWLSQEEACSLLEKAASCLTQNGALVIRQLNSNLAIDQPCKSLSWNKEYAKTLLQKETSFFYRNLYIGEKK
jgi:S-adenosylmethionine-diacylglycerol 3-amino-3-carboxypropyl transferase